MVLIIEEREEHLDGLKKELGHKKDVVIVTTRIAGRVRLSEPGKDYVVLLNGEQVIGEKSVILEKLDVDQDFRV